MQTGAVQILKWGDWANEDGSVQVCEISAYVKVATEFSPHVVVNEYVAGMLGLMLGLPVVPGMIFSDGETFGYASLALQERPPPADVEELVVDHPLDAAGIATFDSWIMNEDRHRGNLAYSRPNTPLAAFDHDMALFAEEGMHRMGRLQNQACVNGCVVQRLESWEDLERWTAKIRQLPEFQLHAAVERAVGAKLISKNDASQMVQILLLRREGLRDMLEDAVKRGCFPRISWERLL